MKTYLVHCSLLVYFKVTNSFRPPKPKFTLNLTICAQVASPYHLAMGDVLKYTNLIYDCIFLYISYTILYIC